VQEYADGVDSGEISPSDPPPPLCSSLEEQLRDGTYNYSWTCPIEGCTGNHKSGLLTAYVIFFLILMFQSSVCSSNETSFGPLPSQESHVDWRAHYSAFRGQWCRQPDPVHIVKGVYLGPLVKVLVAGPPGSGTFFFSPVFRCL